MTSVRRPAALPSSCLCTIEDVSQILSVPVKTIRQWVYKSQIPNIKLNGLVRFDRRVIAHWVQASARQEKVVKESGGLFENLPRSVETRSAGFLNGGKRVDP